MSLTPRVRLVSYKGTVVTPDTASALRRLTVAVSRLGGARLVYRGVPQGDTTWARAARQRGPTGLAPRVSLRPSGREVYLSLQFQDGSSRDDAVAALWGLAVPLGFIPWNRYPVVNDTDAVFHYFGYWQGLYDHICGDGQGEWAWPSLCAAAQIEVGSWNGDKTVERYVQSQLHRLGVHCGPVNGIIEERTITALRALGIQQRTLSEVADVIGGMETPKPSKEQRSQGYLVAPGRDLSVLAYGGVHSVRTNHGAALTIDGPGRLVVDVGQVQG